MVGSVVVMVVLLGAVVDHDSYKGIVLTGVVVEAVQGDHETVPAVSRAEYFAGMKGSFGKR